MPPETGLWRAGPLPLYWRGAALEAGAVPTLLYLSVGGEETLSLDPFCQPSAFFVEGGAPRRVITFDLPCHGGAYDKRLAMQSWADSFARGVDLLEPFVAQAKETLDLWCAAGMADVRYCAFAGLSRGALPAGALAALYPEVLAYLAFAPMTSLAAVAEFARRADDANVRRWDLQHCYEGLYRHRLRCYIGNGDERVGTDRCYHFVKGLADYARGRGLRSPPHEMVMLPSVGAAGHGTLPPVFRAGVQWLVALLPQ